MTENVSSFGNELVDNINLKVKLLTALLSEIKESNHNNEFDPAVCNDIYAYISIVQADCQKLMNNNKYHSISNKHDAIQQINGNAF